MLLLSRKCWGYLRLQGRNVCNVFSRFTELTAFCGTWDHLCINLVKNFPPLMANTALEEQAMGKQCSIPGLQGHSLIALPVLALGPPEITNSTMTVHRTKWRLKLIKIWTEFQPGRAGLHKKDVNVIIEVPIKLGRKLNWNPGNGIGVWVAHSLGRASEGPNTQNWQSDHTLEGCVQ